jgi:hypothetical protein
MASFGVCRSGDWSAASRSGVAGYGWLRCGVERCDGVSRGLESADRVTGRQQLGLVR